MNRTLPSCAILFAAFLMALPSSHAQEFNKEVLIDGLNSPVGIHADLYGNLYFTEVPSPGEAGADNTVNRYRLRNGRTRVISEGEPYPSNLSADLRGNVYWTCQSAGVILKATRFGRGDKSVILEGLSNPVGIDIPLFKDIPVFTQIPTPGVPGTEGGENEVNAALDFFGSKFVVPLSEGEPEPSDVAVGLDGTVYWTCKTAGVILKRTTDGDVSLVLDGLNSPVGIDVDYWGRIYWTEVPTPGVSGDDGGENKVLRYSPRSGETLVISEGEPEPVDVTVNYYGNRIYWTCKTAGVIVRAYRNWN